MLRIIWFCLLLGFVGCGPRYVDYFPYYDDGAPKPKIVLLPVLDSSKEGSAWSPAPRLTHNLYEELKNSGDCYVLSQQDMGTQWDKIHHVDILDSDLSHLSQCSCADFIVALELIEYAFSPCENKIQTHPRPANLFNCLLMTKVRIKIIDVRGDIPRVILHEIIGGSYIVPKEYSRFCHEALQEELVENFQALFYRVHQPIISELANRIELAIWSAQ